MCTNFEKLTPDDIQFSNVVDYLTDIDKWILGRYSNVVSQATEYLDNFQFDKERKVVGRKGDISNLWRKNPSQHQER